MFNSSDSIRPVGPGDDASQAGASGRPGSLLTLKRGLQALEAIAKARGELSPKDLSREIGVNIGTAYQILRTLTDTGYIQKQSQSGYGLGPQVGYLASFLADQPLNPDAVRVIKDLNDVTRESVYLSLRQGNSLRIVSAFEGMGPVRVQTLTVGYGGDLHARASGKVFLSFLKPDEVDAFLPSGPLPALTSKTITNRRMLHSDLERIRADGYATDSDEFAEGVACIAAPIFSADGSVSGVVGLSRPSFAIDEDQTTRLVAEVSDAAERISELFGGAQPKA